MGLKSTRKSGGTLISAVGTTMVLAIVRSNVLACASEIVHADPVLGALMGQPAD